MADKPKVAESGVLRACLDLLAAERIWHRRWNTGAVKDGKRFFRFGQKGDADIQAILRVHRVFFKGIPQYELILGFNLVLWIECKAEGKKQTDDQIRFEYEVGKEGHQYLLVRDVSELQDWLKRNK